MNALFLNNKRASTTLGFIITFILLLALLGLGLYLLRSTGKTAGKLSPDIINPFKACYGKEVGDECSLGGVEGRCSSFGCKEIDPRCEDKKTGDACSCEGITTGDCATAGSANRVKNYMVCTDDWKCITKCSFCANFKGDTKPGLCLTEIVSGFDCREMTSSACVIKKPDCVTGFCPKDNEYCAKR